MNRSQLRGDLPEPVRRYFREVSQMQPPSDLLDGVILEIERTPTVQRFSILPIVGLAAAAIAAAAVLAFNLLPAGLTNIGADSTPSASPSATPSPVAVATHPPLEDLPQAGNLAEIHEVGDAGFPVLYAHGSVWLSNQETGVLSRLDPATGEVVGSVEVNPDPENTRYDLLAVADDRWVWATGVDDTVVKIDPETDEVVERINVGTLVYRMVIHDGDLWLTDLDQGGRVLRLDLDTGELVVDQRHALWPAGLAVTDTAVWMVPYQDAQIYRLDPQTGEVVDRYPSWAFGMQIEVHGDSLYITGNQERPVERFSIPEERVVARTAELAQIAFDGDRLYGVRWDGAFLELDPVTLEPIAALPIEGGETASLVLGDGVFFLGQGNQLLVVDHTH